MSIEPDREQYFQYGTYAAVGLLLVVCACYGLIFLFPYANPISWLRPPTTQQQLGLQQFPATWTPIPTFTATATPSNTSTNTPTDTSTATPTATDTPLPTATFTELPSPTARPATAVPPTQPPAPTNTPPPAFAWKNYPDYYRCEHSGGTYIHVIVGTAPGQPVAGITTRLSYQPDPNGAFIDDADTNGNGDATHVLAGTGRPARVGTYYAWLVDSITKQRISDVSSPILINGKKENQPGSCWQAYVYFGPS